ncbi:hypothetical protein HPB47_024969 [Ixodes persulcatus]|uniref:Uncharacterized protein n=1 Tax=Ixodes persulcatus TaxID=34615 RepID=A0AC60Q3B5_IXOPE|nr:hypothetical protein HPB47_024969 [Ixodes persulcatus]
MMLRRTQTGGKARPKEARIKEGKTRAGETWANNIETRANEPETGAEARANKVKARITFGDIAVPEAQLKHVDTKQPYIYAQKLAVMVFGTEALANCCLTGPAMKGKLPKEGVWDLIDHVVPEEKERCLSEAVDTLLLRTTVQRVEPRTSCVVSYLQENNLKLLTGGKEGGFVVLPQGLYDEKSSKAITKDFKQVDVSLQKIKKKAVEICERLELSNLARRVKRAKKLNLDVFFTAKTHKVECPLRTIVTESLSWQKEILVQKLQDIPKKKIPFLLDSGDFKLFSYKG